MTNVKSSIKKKKVCHPLFKIYRQQTINHAIKRKHSHKKSNVEQENDNSSAPVDVPKLAENNSSAISETVQPAVISIEKKKRRRPKKEDKLTHFKLGEPFEHRHDYKQYTDNKSEKYNLF